MTLRPYLNDELLTTTFRNLVLNDLVDQIAFPVTQFINTPQYSVYFDGASADIRSLFEGYDNYQFNARKHRFRALQDSALKANIPADLYKLAYIVDLQPILCAQSGPG